MKSGIKTFIAQIPKIHLLFFGKILGNLLYYLAVPQRRIVRRNLQFSHVRIIATANPTSCRNAFFGISELPS